VSYNLFQKQQGFSISGLIFWSVIFILLAIPVIKVVPAYIENATIQETLASIVDDPDIQNMPPRQIREDYLKRAQLAGIVVISAGDIEINRDKGKTVLSVNYSVVTPLFANISLHIDFEASSE